MNRFILILALFSVSTLSSELSFNIKNKNYLVISIGFASHAEQTFRHVIQDSVVFTDFLTAIDSSKTSEYLCGWEYEFTYNFSKRKGVFGLNEECETDFTYYQLEKLIPKVKNWNARLFTVYFDRKYPKQKMISFLEDKNLIVPFQIKNAHEHWDSIKVEAPLLKIPKLMQKQNYNKRCDSIKNIFSRNMKTDFNYSKIGIRKGKTQVGPKNMTCSFDVAFLGSKNEVIYRNIIRDSIWGVNTTRLHPASQSLQIIGLLSELPSAFFGILNHPKVHSIEKIKTW